MNLFPSTDIFVNLVLNPSFSIDIRPRLRHNNAEHGSPHAQPQARSSHVSRRLRSKPTRDRRLRGHRPGHARGDI